MQLTLYQISEDLRAMLDDAFDPETGEALPAFEEKRALWGSKAAAVAAYVLNTELDSARCADVLARVKARQGVLDRKAAHLRNYLRDNMANSGIREIRADDGSFCATLYVGRDKSVDVFDAEQLPADCMREIPARQEPDKAAIKARIDAGAELAGARIVAKDRLTLK